MFGDPVGRAKKIETKLQRSERIKRGILNYLKRKKLAKSENPTDFSFLGIENQFSDDISSDEIDDALTSLVQDDKLIRKSKYEANLYFLSADNSSFKRFKDFLSPVWVGLIGVAILYLAASFYSFNTFDYPEIYRAGFIIGIAVGAIFAKPIGEIVWGFIDYVLDRFFTLDSVKKKAIMIILGMVAACVALYILLVYLVRPFNMEMISALGVITAAGVGVALGIGVNAIFNGSRQ